MQQSDDDLDFGKGLEEIESAEVELDFAKKFKTKDSVMLKISI